MTSGKRNDREGPKEIPGQKNFPGMPFFIPAARLPIREERDTLLRRRAGLLASGSSYSPPFPSMLTVAIRLSSPVTAAGPQRIYTVFPLVPEGTAHLIPTAPTLAEDPSSDSPIKSIEKRTCKWKRHVRAQKLYISGSGALPIDPESRQNESVSEFLVRFKSSRD